MNEDEKCLGSFRDSFQTWDSTCFSFVNRKTTEDLLTFESMMFLFPRWDMYAYGYVSFVEGNICPQPQQDWTSSKNCLLLSCIGVLSRTCWYNLCGLRVALRKQIVHSNYTILYCKTRQHYPKQIILQDKAAFPKTSVWPFCSNNSPFGAVEGSILHKNFTNISPERNKNIFKYTKWSSNIFNYTST